LQEAFLFFLWLFGRWQLAPPPGFASGAPRQTFLAFAVAEAASAVIVTEVLLCGTSLLTPALLAVKFANALRDVADNLLATLASFHVAALTCKMCR
jgi:hypothetical protein